MATPETLCAELDPLVEREENQIVKAEVRELSAYSFDSDDKTLAGIGTSGSADSSRVHYFDSSDRTLVGIGPAEREKRAKLAESAACALRAEPTPESVPMPLSEAPGPFVASDDDDAPPRLPMKQREPWLLALSAVLIASAAVALLRGGVLYKAAPRQHSATTDAPLPPANGTRPRSAQFESAAATPAETSAVEIASTPFRALLGRQASEAPAPAASSATAQREQQLELEPRPASSAKLAGIEPLGALNVTSNPPSGLVLDGRPLGKAPRVIQLPAGPHTVLFVHPQRGRMSVTVNVRPGRTTVASANF